MYTNLVNTEHWEEKATPSLLIRQICGLMVRQPADQICTPYPGLEVRFLGNIATLFIGTVATSGL